MGQLAIFLRPCDSMTVRKSISKLKIRYVKVAGNYLQVTASFLKDCRWYFTKSYFLSLYNLHSSDIFCTLRLSLKFSHENQCQSFCCHFHFHFHYRTLWGKKNSELANQWLLTSAANVLEKHCVFSNVWYCIQLLMETKYKHHVQ